MPDGTQTPQDAIQPRHEEMETKTLEEGIKKVRRTFKSAHLDEPRIAELLPEGKTVSYIDQQSYHWFERIDDPYEPPHDFGPGTVDGEIFSVHFTDGSSSFFMHSKVPAHNPWRNLGSELPAYDMAINNTATWDGKDHMEVVIPLKNPTQHGPVIDRIDVQFDGTNTTFSTKHPNKLRTKQTVPGDLAKPDFMLEQWEEHIKRRWDYPSQTIKLPLVRYGEGPAVTPVSHTPLQSVV